MKTSKGKEVSDNDEQMEKKITDTMDTTSKMNGKCQSDATLSSSRTPPSS
jgi:hypothetical protein